MIITTIIIITVFSYKSKHSKIVVIIKNIIVPKYNCKIIVTWIIFMVISIILWL